MEAGNVLRMSREGAGQTQGELGRRVGASPWSIRAYEKGLNPLPADVAARASQVLRAPEICLALCEACPANLLLNVPDLVDKHPLAQLVNAQEEVREAIEMLQGLDLLNRVQLNGAEMARLERAADQLYDVVAAAAVALAVWSRQYGLDLQALKQRHRRKLELRGYVAREGDEPQALPRLEGVAP